MLLQLLEKGVFLIRGLHNIMCRAGHAFKSLTSHRVAQLETKELIGAGVATSKEICMHQCTRGP